MSEEIPFKKYYLYKRDENGKIMDINKNAFELADEAFILFKSMYDLNYGSINEDDNLISIHTGGWSENEYLVQELKETSFWLRYHRITAKGGHFFFDTDFYAEKEWLIQPNK